MKTAKKWPLWTGVIVALAVLIVVGNLFAIYEMHSTSMEPTLSGRRDSSRGDMLLGLKVFSPQRLKTNDLVVVSFSLNGNWIRTVRRISALPGDVVNGRPIPENHFHISSEAAKGIDSSQLGAIPSSQIEAKVLKNLSRIGN